MLAKDGMGFWIMFPSMHSLAGLVSGNFRNSSNVSVLEGVCTIWAYLYICQAIPVFSLPGNSWRLIAESMAIGFRFVGEENLHIFFTKTW